MTKPPLWTQEFLGMSFSNFFQYMTHYALVTTLPIFVMEKLQGNEWQAGLAMTFFQIGAVCCRPFAGKWNDTYNKKKMLFISSLIFLLISVLYLVVDRLSFLLTIRLFHGAVFAVGTTTVATLAALILPMQRKGEGIGYFAVFSNLAMVVGPFLGLFVISQHEFNPVFLGCITLALLSFWCSNRKSLPDDITQPVTKTISAFKIVNFIEPKAIPMAVMGGCVFFAYAGVLVIIPLYTKILGLSTYTSLFFAVFACSIVLTRPLVGKIFDRAGANYVIYPGFFLFILGLIFLSYIQDSQGLLLSAATIGIGFGALSPAFQTLAIQNSPSIRAGVATATYFLALDVSVGIGSFVLSLVAGRLGYHFMYLASAVVIVFTTLLYYYLMRIHNKDVKCKKELYKS